MPNLSVQIGADTSKLVAGINQAKATLQDYIKAQDEASNASDENSSVTKEQAQAYEKVINSLQKVAEGSLSTKQSQKELANSVKELKEQWAALNNEARASSFGQSMSETMAAAKAELQEMKNSMSSVGDVKPNGTMKKELRLTTNELINLTAQYRAMSAAEQKSAEGQALAQKMNQIRAKAGELKDTIGDVNTEITAMASDTPNLSAFGEILGVTGDLLSAHASIIAKVTGDEKALKDAIATVMAVQTTYNAVIKIANAQETFASTLAKVRKVQDTAAAAAISIKTAAEGKGVIVTKAATIAQAAFNKVAAMNPYVLIAMAIVSAIGAIAAFVSMSDEATESEKANAEAAKSQAEAYNNALNSSLENTIPKYIKLQEEWKNLRSEGEKKQWIEDNKSAFKDLGVEVTTVGDAENFLVTNTQAAMNAFMQRAKAAAMAAKANEIYKQSLEDIAWLEEQRGSKSVKSDELKAHGSSTGESKARLDHHGGLLGTGHGRYEIDVDKAIEARRAKAEAAVRELYQQLAKEEEKGQKTLSEAGIKTAVAGEKKKSEAKKKEIHKGSVEEAEEELKVWQQALNQADVSNEELIKNINNKIKEAEEEVRTRKIKIGIGIDPNSLQGMEDEISKLRSDYKKGWRTDLDSKSFNKEIKKMERAIRNKKIELGLKAEFTREMQRDLEQEIEETLYKLNMAVDENSKAKIKDELNKLTHLKATVDAEFVERDRLNIKPVIDYDELDDITRKVDKQWNELMRNKYGSLEFPPDPTSGLTKWRKKAENELRRVKFLAPDIRLKTNDDPDRFGMGSLTDQMDKQKAIVDSLESKYDEITKKIEKCKSVTREQIEAMQEYVIAERGAENIKEMYFDILRAKELGIATDNDVKDALDKYLDSCDDLSLVTKKYGDIVYKVKELTGVTNAEVYAMAMYEDSSDYLSKLTDEYKNATDAAYEFNRKAMISERRWDVFKSGINTIGGLTSSLNSNAQAWADISGKELSKGFKDTMAVIDATINSINMLVSAYEGINNIIKLFGEISDITSAKRIASNTAEMASDESLIASQTANTQVKIANDTAENTSEIGKLGVKEGSAIASATASGAALPFPANIAAIAAGIAAVVAAFALVFSAFAEGGIVGGGSHIGDSQLVRVNSGEMILNGQQQKRLFNLLNGTNSRNGATVGEGGVVKFKIKGNNLYGVLNNHIAKQNRV